MSNSFVKKYLIFLLLVFILFTGYIFIANKSSQNQSLNLNNKTYETKNSSQGNIEVEVTPKILSSTQNSSFEVGINNHQVDLNYNLAKIAVLTDDKGKKYSPLSWNGPEGGHHSNGVLVFPPLSKNAKSVNLLLPKIGAIDRTFSWKLY